MDHESTSVARAGAQKTTPASRSPSPRRSPSFAIDWNGESFNWNGCLAGLEDTVPAGARWWREKARECVKAKLESGEIERVWAKTLGWTLERYPDLIWPKVGIRPGPTRLSEITPSVIRTLRDSPAYAPKTRSQYLQSLRHMLRFLGSPLAEDRHLWTLDARAARRRWLTKPQLRAIWTVCRDDLDRLGRDLLGKSRADPFN